MPCDSVTTMQIDAGKMLPALALEALRAMGLSPVQVGALIIHAKGNYDPATGTATWQTRRYGASESAETLNGEFRRAYAKANLQVQARRLGMTVKQDANNPLKFQLIKR